MPDFLVCWPIGHSEARVSHSINSHCSDHTFSDSLADQDLQIAGYWRGDNAALLSKSLGLSSEASPAHILAAAWQQQGSAFVERLAGPFALALFDAHQSILFAARDAMGVEPLFIAQTNTTIAIANAPQAARAGAALASTPNPATIAGFLRGDLPDTNCTFHQGLTRLPPGHTIAIRGAAPATPRRFYDLRSVPSQASLDDPVSQFREALDKEVARCGANDDHVAILLSGGLDSSALAGSIQHQRTNPMRARSLSMMFEADPRWADAPYLTAIRQVSDMDHHGFEGSDHDPMTHMGALLEALDGPCLGLGSSVNVELYQMANELGVTTVFNGHGGDEVVSHGLGRLNELARAGRWRELWIEAEGAAPLMQMPRWRVFEHFLQHKRRWRQLRGFVSSRWPHRSGGPPSASELDALLAPELAAAHPATDPLSAPHTRPDYTERDLHEHALLQPMQPHSLETLTLSLRHWGLNLAMPFYARDLVELSLSLSPDWKLRGGYTRYVLREAMRGRVPDAIINRRDKNDFSADLIRNTIRSEAVNDWTRTPGAALSPYINSQNLTEIWTKVERDPDAVSVFEARALWSVAVLAQWLDSDRDVCLKASY